MMSALPAKQEPPIRFFRYTTKHLYRLYGIDLDKPRKHKIVQPVIGALNTGVYLGIEYKSNHTFELEFLRKRDGNEEYASVQNIGV